MALGLILKICEMGPRCFSWARLFSLGVPRQKQSINVYFPACPLSQFWYLCRADSRVFPAWISSRAVQRVKVLFLVLSIGFAKALTLCLVRALPLPSVSFLPYSGPCLQPTNRRSIWLYGFPRNNDLFLCSNFFCLPHKGSASNLICLSWKFKLFLHLHLWHLSMTCSLSVINSGHWK